MTNKFSRKVELKHWALPVLVMLVSVYLTSYLVLRYGFPASALMVLPITFVGWQYGRWAGLIAGALTTTGLYEFVNLMGGPTSDFLARGFGPGFFGLSALGFLIGYANEQTRTSKRAVRVAELARDLMELVAADLPLNETLNDLTLRIEKDLEAGRCSILLLNCDSGTLNHACAPSLPDAFCQAIDGLRIGPAVGSCGTAAFRNELVIVEDIQQDPLWVDYRELAAEHRLAACWSKPISNSEGEVLGTFAIYYGYPCGPDGWELEIVNKAAASAQIALARHRDKERQKQLEEQVQTAQKLEGLGLLAGGIAHDFNNMLASVMGNAELLTLDLTDHAHRKRAVAITDAATRAADLAKQMLIYAGKGAQQLVEVELSAMVNDFEALANAAMPKTVRLDLDLAGNLPSLVADETQLQQVLMNLLVNAADAIGPDKVGTIWVRTSCKDVTRKTLDQTLLGKNLAAGSYLCLEVEDDGAGISDELKKQIFDPFFSTKSTSRGLGLAVIFGVVMRHRGTIILDSEVGKGTCFTILLPLPDQKIVPVLPHRSDSHQPLSSSGSALVIDDESSVRDVAKQFLKKLGFENVHEASGGLEGVKSFRRLSGELTLVLIDLTMPDINGREVLKQIESLPSAARCILMTGYDVATHREDTEEIANSILHKPFNLESLYNAIVESQI